MKIGILTHHYVKNFGAYMQVFGLMNTIKKMYPKVEVEIIDYRVKKHEKATTIHFFGYKTSRGDTFLGYIKKIHLFFTHMKYEKKLPRSIRLYDANDINKQNYDLIIVGSDEVWNFNDIAYSPIKFGVGINAPMITYSASAGGSSKNDNIPEDVFNGINKFRGIAVRDENTGELVKAVSNKGYSLTLDPVFLFDYTLNCRKSIQELANEKYLLIYDCRLTNKQVKALKEYADKRGLKIYGAGEYRNWYSGLKTVNVNPFEWAYLFKNAYGIITGTFHGTSFSIKYNKKFVAYLTEINRMKKVGSLLNQFNLQDHIASNENPNEIIAILEKDIYYEPVNIIIKEKVNMSKKYLKKEIDEIEKGLI